MSSEITAAVVSRPRVYHDRPFGFGPRFGEREVLRFPPPIGPVGVVLAQDEVVAWLA